MGRLTGKTAMITGCNRGIGKAMAEKFASEGANLICAIRKENPAFLKETESWSHKYGVRIDFVYFDLTDEAGIRQAFKELNTSKTKIDVLVNNAGTPSGGLFLLTPLDEIKRVMQINFFSQVLITQHVAKMMMRQKKGSIINISSIVALDNQGGWTAYGSSKGAVISFTRTAARELAQLGIRVNAVAPGLVDTDMGNEMDGSFQNDIIARSDMGRKGTPEEIANLVCFLASDEASFITGQIIRIDGGM